MLPSSKYGARNPDRPCKFKKQLRLSVAYYTFIAVGQHKTLSKIKESYRSALFQKRPTKIYLEEIWIALIGIAIVDGLRLWVIFYDITGKISI
jgi:hypothetical protein